RVWASAPLENPNHPSTVPAGATTGPKHAAVPSVLAGGTPAGSPASATAVAPALIDELPAELPPPAIQPSRSCAGVAGFWTRTGTKGELPELPTSPPRTPIVKPMEFSGARFSGRSL